MGTVEGELIVTQFPELEHITSYISEQLPNEHPKVKLQGEMKKGKNVNDILKSLKNRRVVVNRKRLSGELVKVFNGYVEKYTIEDRGNDYYRIKLALIGSSSQLDYKKRECSFQNVSWTHRQVVEQVVCSENLSVIRWNVAEEFIGMPVIQYRETDWEFIKRMASIYQVPVMVDVRTDKALLNIGVLKTSKKTLNKKFFTTGISSHYYEIGGNKAGYKKSAFQYYKVVVYEDFQLGEPVAFNGIDCYVCGKWGKLEGTELLYTYLLGGKELLTVSPIENQNFIGSTIKGKVLYTRNETVKLDLQLKDDSHDISSAYAYDWKPESGNILYCMPQKGTVCSLYLGDAIESSASVVNCIRTNGGTSVNMDNPSNKHFKTEHGLNFDLEMEQINFSVPQTESIDNNAVLDLIDKTAVLFDTKANITMVAKKEISFECDYFFWGAYQGNIGIIASPYNNQSSIIMFYQFNVLGSYTNLQFIPSDIAYPFINDAPIEAEKEGFSWMKAIGNIAAGIVTAGIVTLGVCVAAAAIVGSGGLAGPVVVGAAIGGLSCGCFQAVVMTMEDYSNDTNSSIGDYMLRCGVQSFIGAIVGAVSGGLGEAATASGVQLLGKTKYLSQGVSKGLDLVIDVGGNVISDVADKYMTHSDIRLQDELFMAVSTVGTHFIPWNKIFRKKDVDATTTYDALKKIQKEKKVISETAKELEEAAQKHSDDVSKLMSEKKPTKNKGRYKNKKYNKEVVQPKIDKKNAEFATTSSQLKNKEMASKNAIDVAKDQIKNNVKDFVAAESGLSARYVLPKGKEKISEALLTNNGKENSKEEIQTDEFSWVEATPGVFQ